MGLFSDSLVYAADSTAVQGGDLSFGQKAGGVVAGAVISGLGSIYNTGVAAANALGGGLEEIDTYNSLQSLDQGWADYYKGNQTAIDVAGFVAGSLVPGMAAIKGLNLLRAGEGVGAFGRALGFTRRGQMSALDAGLKELAVEGGSVFTRINQNKMKVLGWEFADQTLQAAVFELGVALTMKQSPLLADDSWWDIGKSIATGALLGGGIGGGIGALGLNKAFKAAVKGVDSRSADYTAVSGLGRLGLDTGDQAYGLIESILKIPKEVLEKDKLLEIAFPLGSGPVTKKVDISSVLTNVAKASTKAAMEEFELKLRKLVGGNEAATGAVQPETAQAFSQYVLGRFTKLTKAGAQPSQIQEEMLDVLGGLKSVTAATDEPLLRPESLMYFKKTITPEELANVKSINDLKDLQTRNTPYGKDNQAYNQPYIFTGTEAQFTAERLAIIGVKGEDGFPTLEAAWKAGYNLAKTPDNALRVNRDSRLWKKVKDPVYDSRRYFNTRTGAVTEDTVLTAADRMPGGKSLKIDSDGVIFDLPEGLKKVKMADNYKPGQSVAYATARHAWASELPEKFFPNTVDATDISLLERLVELSADVRTSKMIRHADGSTVSGDLASDVLLNSKISSIQAEFATGMKDTREVAYRYSVPEPWLEKLIASEYGTALPDISVLKEGMSRNISEFARRENVVASYAKPQQFTYVDPQFAKLPWKERRALILEQAANHGGQFVTGELAYAYRVQQAVKANQNAAGTVLGAEKLGRLVKLNQDAAKLADSLGSGASFLGASNANYGDTLRLAAQDVGKHTHQWIQEASNDVVSSFASAGARLTANPRAGAELGIVTNILRNDPGKFVLMPALLNDSKTLVRRELAAIADPGKFAEVEARMIAEGKRTRIDIVEQDTMDWLVIHQKLSGGRTDKSTVLLNARGMTSNKDPNVFYAPPIDTNYFQHFAFVRPIEGKAFGTSEVSMVFGRNAEELQKRIALVSRDNFDVITKDGSERYFKAKGDYDFDQTINERTIDSELRRTGALSNFFPETRTQNIVEDYLRWHQNQASRLIRNAVESNYSQQVEELRALGRSYSEDATSKFSGTLRSAKSEIVNPYEDYVKTMLDVSKRSEYRFFHQANEFVDALGTRAYQMLSTVTGKAQKGLIPWEEANAIAEKHGISGMYSGTTDYFASNVPRDRNLVKEFVAKANTLLANLVLRFDFAQSIMNVVSTPLLLGTELASIRNLAAKDPDALGALAELTTVGVPGMAGQRVPSALKLQANAIRNFFGPEKEALLKRYKDNGDVKDILSLYHSAIEDLAMSPNFKVFSDRTTAAADKVATLTGNNWAEEFTRFVSADVMRQLTEPLVSKGSLTLQEANAYISTFVNRVQGNYISSQRPVVFQGVLGGAIGLFQTYSFNLLQQLLQHVENKDARAVATMFGMQSGLFGLNGTPLFDAINTHIIGNAAINQGHYDAYSIAPELVGKDMGDWLMYGTVSAMPGFGDKWPALYSRGDINPRHMTILPMTPMQVPAIDASIRIVGNLLDVGKKLLGGADISQALLQGLEHNGVNRPLAGLAQVLAGQSTTSKGALISANSDMELIANAARIVGAKPMDEAIALNNMYRLKSYQAADRDRITALGEVVKTKLVQGGFPTDEEFNTFMADYTKIGGTSAGFSGTLQGWMKDANTSTIEKMRAKMNTTTGQRLNEIMGDTALPSYTAPAVDGTLQQ
jgi:hypothetical protein